METKDKNSTLLCNISIAQELYLYSNKMTKHQIEVHSQQFSPKIKWTFCSKEDFIADLSDWINDVQDHRQGKTNLCGLTVACKLAIQYDSSTFVQLALSLYFNGKYTLSKIVIAANIDLLATKPRQGLNTAQYIVMSSLRDAMNTILSYNPHTDKGWHGFTYPNDIVKLLTAFPTVECVAKSTHFTSLFNLSLVDIEKVKLIKQSLDQEASIVLLFDWRKLKHNKRSLNRWHYVQLVSIDFIREQCDFCFWNPSTGKQYIKNNFSFLQFQKALKGFWIFDKIKT